MSNYINILRQNPLAVTFWICAGACLTVCLFPTNSPWVQLTIGAIFLIFNVCVIGLNGSHVEKQQFAPAIGEYLLYLFLPKTEREYVVGDLIEGYNNIRVKFGTRRAKLWFYWQVIISIRPLVSRSMMRLLESKNLPPFEGQKNL